MTTQPRCSVCDAPINTHPPALSCHVSPPSREQQELARFRQQQSERARVAKFMGCSIEKVVRGRDGGWTTR